MALTNVFQADNIKTTSPNVISPTFLILQFVSLWAPSMIRLTAGTLTDPQLPARASNVCKAGWHRPGGIATGWHRPGAPPNKNPGYAGGVRLVYWSLRSTATFVICFHWSLLLAFISTFLPSLPFSDFSSHSPLILTVVVLVFWNLLASLSRIFSVIYHLSL